MGSVWKHGWFSIGKRVVGRDGWVLVCASAGASAEAVRRKGAFCNGNVIVFGWVLGFLSHQAGQAPVSCVAMVHFTMENLWI